MARKSSPSDCMFCQMGDCEEHAPKPAPVKKNVSSRSAGRSPVAADGGKVRSPRDSAPREPVDPRPLPSVQQLQEADPDGEDVVRQASLALLRGGLLDMDEVKSRRIFLGPDAQPYIKAHDWKQRIGHGDSRR